MLARLVHWRWFVDYWDLTSFEDYSPFADDEDDEGHEVYLPYEGPHGDFDG